jgi:acylphosphatase
LRIHIKGDMKLKIKITGPKVHDVGYRYFLLGIAMSNRIRMFEAHNTKSSEGEEVLLFADGDEAAIKAFCNQIETERPAHAEVSNIVFDDFDGEVMKIGEYAQFCATVQLNKAIPVLLDMRDDMKEMSGDMKEMKGDLKAVRKTGDETLSEIKGLRDDIQPGYSTRFSQMQADVRAIKERLGMH